MSSLRNLKRCLNVRTRSSEFDFTKPAKKKCECYIFLLNKIVLQRLHKSDLREWEKFVRKDWFDSENADSAPDFLDRGEPFLSATFGGTQTRGAKILGKLIPANSYVVFFRMDSLTSLLMREHCRVQHALNTQLQSQQAQTRTAEKRLFPTSINTVSLIVSSANWHECLSEDKRHSQAHVTRLVVGLQRIACLPMVLLDDHQVPLSRASHVEKERKKDGMVQVCAEAHGVGGGWVELRCSLSPAEKTFSRHRGGGCPPPVTNGKEFLDWLVSSV